MQIGVFSDIHGNIYAFERVWKALKEASCDLYVFLGDICGYYYYQNEIIDTLISIDNLICVKGNHDDLFLRSLKDKDLANSYLNLYGTSNRLLSENITKRRLQFLSDLPTYYVISEYNIGIFHGSPKNYLNEYIYPDTDLTGFENVPFTTIFLGHTHYPMCREFLGKCIVNPGSSGQPRDYNKPSYAIFNTDSREVEFKRVSYNVNLLIDEVKRMRETNDYLINVLEREKVKNGL